MYAETTATPKTTEFAGPVAGAAAEPRGFAASPFGARGTALAFTTALSVLAFVFGGITQSGSFFVVATVLLVIALLGASAMLDEGDRAEDPADDRASLADALSAMRGAAFSTVHPSMHAVNTGR